MHRSKLRFQFDDVGQILPHAARPVAEGLVGVRVHHPFVKTAVQFRDFLEELGLAAAAVAGVC
jgi:hypothetical protein